MPKGWTYKLLIERRSHYFFVIVLITARRLFRTATEVLVQVRHRKNYRGKDAETWNDVETNILDLKMKVLVVFLCAVPTLWMIVQFLPVKQGFLICY